MIPHTLHRIWLGSQMPREHVLYGRTWQAHHPTWDHVLWTDCDQPEVDEQVRIVRYFPISAGNFDLFREAEQYAPRNLGQFKADILRYEIMLGMGGVYVDTDFECLKPIDPLLVPSMEAFAAWEMDNVWINNAILGAVPGHPFFQQLVDGLAASVRAHPGSRPNVMTGPQYVTATYRANERLGLPRIAVFRSRFFYPYLWNELARRGEHFPEAFAVHHWSNRRRAGS